MSLDVTTWSLTVTLQKLREGKISLVEYLTDLLAHSKQHNNLGIYITDTGEQALALAKAMPLRDPTKLLYGIPLVVKDNIDVAGVPTTAGTPRLKHHIPQMSSGVWQQLNAQGALLFGKTSMHELAYGVTGQCTGSPTALNPRHTHYLAGGSSSGTATAVAAGFVPAGLGTDTGGSVRIPAAVCGICGFRPTTGRYPNSGIVLISPTRDTVGIMARSVDDIMLLDSIITGTPYPTDDLDSAALAMTLAVPEQAWSNLDPDVEHLVLSALSTLQNVGYNLVNTGADIHGGPSDKLLDVATAIPAAETFEAIAAYLKETGSDITVEDVIHSIASPDVRDVLLPLWTHPVSQQSYHDALTKQAHLRELAANAYRHYAVDAVITPTTMTTAAPVDIGDEIMINGMNIPTFLAYIRNTAPAPVLGNPSITIPIGQTAKGLPVGLMLDGAPHSDKQLLQLALQCSRLFSNNGI